jgi:hypothetical protein
MPSVAKSSRIQIFVAFAALLLAAPELSAQDDASFRKPPAPYAFVHPTAKPSELRRRRERLAEILKDGTAILVSDEPASLYSGARYRPGNNIFYFTGVESDFCALVLTAKDGAIASETLFLPAYDAHYELWNGKRAVARSGEGFGRRNDRRDVGLRVRRPLRRVRRRDRPPLQRRRADVFPRGGA